MKTERLPFVELAIVGLFWTTGRFGWTNLLGIRREIQAIFLIVLVFALIEGGRSINKKIGKSLLLLCGVSALFVGFRNFNNISVLFNFCASFCCVFLILSRTKNEVLKLEKWIYNSALIFIGLMVIQFGYYLLNPTVFFMVERPYHSYTGSETIYVQHWSQYLGFSVARPPVNILGFEFPRFYSFGSEPSTLVATLLVPGFIAIANNRLLTGFIIVFITTFLAFSGTIFLSIFIGLIVFLTLYVNRKFNRLLSRYLSYGFIMCLVGILPQIANLNVKQFSRDATVAGDSLSGVTNFATSKESSMNTRLTSLQVGLRNIAVSPLGAERDELYKTMGLLLMFGHAIGWAGLIVYLYYLLTIFKGITKSEKQFNLPRLVGLCGMVGCVFQASFFTAHGWWCPAGFTVLALTTAKFYHKT